MNARCYFGEKIRSAREKRKMTLREIKKKAGGKRAFCFLIIFAVLLLRLSVMAAVSGIREIG
jgi:transcriptional regulator with XRE-family HTH domain